MWKLWRKKLSIGKEKDLNDTCSPISSPPCYLEKLQRTNVTSTIITMRKGKRSQWRIKNSVETLLTLSLTSITDNQSLRRLYEKSRRKGRWSKTMTWWEGKQTLRLSQEMLEKLGDACMEKEKKHEWRRKTWWSQRRETTSSPTPRKDRKSLWRLYKKERVKKTN